MAHKPAALSGSSSPQILAAMWARVAVAFVILAALAYHLAVMTSCYQHQPLCYWGGSA